MADTLVLEASAARRGGSSPSIRTKWQESVQIPLLIRKYDIQLVMVLEDANVGGKE